MPPPAGLACLGLGTIFDTLLMPINKSLWTPSFFLLMTGWAAIVFAAFHWLLDVNPYPARWARPFVI